MLKIKVGKITLAKWVCPVCGEENLTGYDSLVCQNRGCLQVFENAEFKRTRVIAGRERRSPISRARAREIAESQDGYCFWCEHEFGSYVLKQNVVRRLEIVVDHVSPWAYSLDHGTKNLVASCQICNGWKSALVFQTEEECRGFLKRKWTRWEQSGLIHFIEDEDAA